MNTIWIVHRDSALRAMLGRLAAGYRIVAGSPTSALFAEAGEPVVVLLGVPADPSVEIAFAQRTHARFPRAGWVLLHERAVAGREVARLFAGLGAEILPSPPRPRSLEAALARLGPGPGPEPFAERAAREQLLARAVRYFEGTRALDRIDEAGPLWIRGEPGTGGLLLARIAHVRSRGTFLHLPCDERTQVEDLAARLAALGAREGAAAGKPLVICLDGAERLGATVQRELRGWVEFGPTLPGLAATELRWILLTDDGPPHALLEPELADAVSEGELRLAPLRERLGAAEQFARATLAAAAEPGQAPRELSPQALARVAEDPWPGNQAALERRLIRVAQTGAGPISPAELGLSGPGEERPAPSPEPPPVVSVPPRPLQAKESPAPAHPAGHGADQQLFQALAHELRNPLVSIRTFASLLPERWEDESFRTEFREQMERDVGRLEGRLERMARYAALHPVADESVNVSAVLLELLDERRPAIEARRLLVLRELETERPFAQGNAAALRFAFESLLSVALDWTGERADLYLASRHHPTGLDGGAAMRVLLRFHGGGEPTDLGTGAGPLSRREVSLDLHLAGVLIQEMGGIFTVDANDDETVILVDLPAPPE
jgi:signal transduction histidine kinase